MKGKQKSGAISGIIILIVFLFLLYFAINWLFWLLLIVVVFGAIVLAASKSEVKETIILHEDEQVLHIDDFMAQTHKAIETRGDYNKKVILENELPSLPSFVEYCMKTDGWLPPYVPCRDMLPELYMRNGEWGKAESVIRLCMRIGAYGEIKYRSEKDQNGHWVPATGEAELALLHSYRLAATAALKFIREEPGALQRNIYNVPTLSHCDRDALKWFCRNSQQIRKEKYKNTNKLYVA